MRRDDIKGRLGAGLHFHFISFGPRPAKYLPRPRALRRTDRASPGPGRVSLGPSTPLCVLRLRFSAVWQGAGSRA